ncbi:MAG: FtsX-like permease family protein, partial [Gammaproteobacteria bacterium]|nr:FtsX-like permease family protein [Gammaproteobacteria bacterium]NIT63027.1 FtsX-like permease family protein [Gammaproteobacteria bacterium]NIV19982.1 FtsX-like permease family protein [Gammaproteobacteria bacterium]NIY31607.1 FtsX-like permease family protein [Gammaproteobacteria bacterium]
VSAIDLSVVQETLDTIVGSVAVAIRFMALFSLVGGGVVLTGAIATSRFQRLRESVLLKTLGARAKQIAQILLTEYAALGTLAGLTGVCLAGLAGWAPLITFLFEADFHLPALPLVGFALAAAVVTAAIGFVSSRDVLRRPPLQVMRDVGE